MNYVGQDVDIGFFPIDHFSVKPDFSFAEHAELPIFDDVTTATFSPPRPRRSPQNPKFFTGEFSFVVRGALGARSGKEPF
jgi:hypothetical protein